MPYIRSMKHLTAFTLAVCLVVSPVLAEDNRPQEKSETGEGLSLMEEGAKMLLRGLLSEMEPAVKDLRGMAENMLPFVENLQGKLGDLSNFHMPEVLPNGDIIIRRKVPLTIEPKDEAEIEL